jgi:predicted transcriptional regulator
MIISVIGAHYLKNETIEGSNWDAVWEQTRSTKIEKLYEKKRLTIFAVANILNLPKETVRRKIENLKKKRLISNSSKVGLMPTDKIEEIIKPFAIREVGSLSKFLQALKKHKTLELLLTLKL